MKLNFKNGKLTVFMGILLINSSLVLIGCDNKLHEENSVILEIPNNNSDLVNIEEKTIIVNEESNSIGSNEENYNETNKDEIVLKYYQDEAKNIEKLLDSNDKDIKQKINEKIVKLVDFLFYDGTIKGITLDEISEETKEKLMFITSKIDDKIDNKIPGYKEAISNKCNDALKFLKEKGKNGIYKLDDYLDKKIDNYDEIKDAVSDVASNTKDDFNELEDLAKSGFSKVKNYYENWREGVKNDND